MSDPLGNSSLEWSNSGADTLALSLALDSSHFMVENILLNMMAFNI
jgi:hypothetical protein